MLQNRFVIRILPMIALIAFILVIFTPITLNMIGTRRIDYPQHIAFVTEIAEGTREIIPHPLFHIGVILIHAVLPGADFAQATFFFIILVYIALGIVIYRLYIRPTFDAPLTWKTALVAIFITLALMTAAAITVFTWRAHSLYNGYTLPNVYHNPTITTLRPFALLVFLFAAGIFSANPFFKTLPAILAAALLMALSTFTKPNYTISVLPALGMVMLYRLYKRELIRWPLLIFGIGLPAVAVIVIQLMMLRTSSVGGGSTMIAPFEVFNQWQTNYILLKFIMSILFPLAVYLAYFRKSRQDLGLNLAWLTFIFGTIYTYFFVEADRVDDGNFIWSGQITLFVLFVVSTAFFLRQIYRPGKGLILSRAAMNCIAIGLVHIISGVVWYITELGPTESWW